MKRILYLTVIALVAFIGNSCMEYDNYDEPKETLKGSIIDKTTGKPLQTEAGDGGVRIKLLEYSWSDNPTPYYLKCQQDGTYINTKIFKGNYNIEPEGPFVPLLLKNSSGDVISDNTRTLDVNGTVEVNFEVEPFLKVEWVSEPFINSDGKLEAQAVVTRGTTNTDYQQNFYDIYLYINYNPYVGNNNYLDNFSERIKYDNAAGNNLVSTATPIKITSKNALTKGRKYYYRIGASINYQVAGSRRYNYTDVKSMDVPN